MANKSKFHSKYSDRGIKLHKWQYALALLTLLGVVLHDSFVHNLPFYYILYAIGGILAGRLVSMTYQIKMDKEKKVFHLKMNNAGIFVLLLLLATKYFIGKLILEEFNVIWITDAIYLFFIGIYYAKFRNIVAQIDEQFYAYIKNKIDE